MTTLEETNKRLKHANSILKSVHKVNRLIVQTKDRDALLQGACECLTETNGYLNAWIALLDDDRKLIAGYESGLGDDFKPMVKMLERGNLPHCIQRVLVGECAFSVEEPATVCVDCPLASSHGGRGGIAVSLVHEGYLHGVMIVSVPVMHAQGTEERELLADAGTDLGYALSKLKQEDSLAESDDLLRLSQQIAQIGSWTLDVPTGSLTWSDETFRIFGYPPQAFEPTYTAFLESVYPDDRTSVDKAYSDSVKSKSDDYEIDHRIIRPDTGEIRFVHEKCTHVRDHDGTIVRSVGMVQDITERKLREKELGSRKLELQESKALLDATGRMAKVGGWEMNVETKELEFTEETYRIHELPLHSAPPLDDAIKFYHEEDQPIIERALGEALEDGKPYDLELRFKTAKGRDLYVRAMCTPILDAGKVVSLRGTFQDITEQKRTVEALRDSEETLRTTLKSIGDAVISTDVDSHVVSMNPVAESLTGWNESEAIGQPLKDVFPIINEHTRKPVENPVTKALETGCIVGLANHALLLAKDGREISIADSCAPIVNDDGELTGVVLVFRDQGEEHATRAELESNYALLKIAGETSRFGGWVVDLEKGTQIWSDVVADIHEVRRGSTPSVQDGINYYAPEYREKITELFTACAERGIPYDEELEVITTEGRRVWVRACGRAVRDEQGKIVKVQGSFQDISEKKRNENKIRAMEKRNQVLLDYSPACHKIVDLDFNLQYMNASGFKMLKLEETEEFYGKPYLFRFFSQASRERMAAELQKVKETQHRVAFEGVACDAEGHDVWFYHTLIPVPDDEGNLDYITVVSADITEQRKVQERLLHSEKMDAIGHLAGGMAHDFNNQLSGVLGYGCLLAERLDDPTLRRYADNICTAARRSADLTQKLLAFSRKGQFQCMPVGMHAVIQETVDMLHHSIDKRIDILLDLHAQETTVDGDPSQLQNTLLNLAINARDAMPAGGTLTFATDVLTFDDSSSFTQGLDVKEGRYIVISVTDTGCGIPEDILPHVFEPFYTTKNEEEGTGMGLASVYGAVKHHKGDIAVESLVGEGTTFTIYLPLSTDIPEDNAESRHSPKPAKALTIFVVDDEEIVRELGRDMLSVNGHSVLTAADGQEAVDLYREKWEEIDLVVLDMVMPRMSGHDAFREMKLINPRVKAILASGYSMNEESQAILAEGVLDFVQKPFDQSRLLGAIQQAMAGENDHLTVLETLGRQLDGRGEND